MPKRSAEGLVKAGKTTGSLVFSREVLPKILWKELARLWLVWSSAPFPLLWWSLRTGLGQGEKLLAELEGLGPLKELRLLAKNHWSSVLTKFLHGIDTSFSLEVLVFKCFPPLGMIHVLGPRLSRYLDWPLLFICRLRLFAVVRNREQCLTIERMHGRMKVHSIRSLHLLSLESPLTETGFSLAACEP